MITYAFPLPDKLVARLASLPPERVEALNAEISEVVADFLAEDASGKSEELTVNHTPLTPRQMRSLPKGERDRLMREAAEAMAPLYEADLALPPHQRELTAFTVLDGVDPVRDPEDYLHGGH